MFYKTVSSFRERFRLSSLNEVITLGRNRRWGLLAAQILITTSLLWAFIFFFDWNRIGETVASVRLDFLFGAVVCLAAILMLGALNIWILLNGVTEMSFKSTLYVYLLSWCTFLLVPGSTGDAIQLFLLKETGVPYRDSGSVYITDKIVSLSAAILVAVTGGLIYFRLFFRPWILLGLFALPGLVVTAAYKLGQRSSNMWILRVLNFAGAPIVFYKNHPARVRMNAVGTLIKLVITTLSHWFTFGAVGVEMSFGIVLTVAVLASLVAYIPVAFNGVGTVEFAAVTLYGVYNVPAHQVLATYLILRASNLALAFAGALVSGLLSPRPSVSLLHGNGS
jgi:uncharacterized protein (TIRG00374 family)